MDQIIKNPGFNHISEKFLLNLPFKDIMACQFVNKSTKQILENPLFWIKKWISKGLSKKNRTDWIKTIRLMENTKLVKLVILYIKRILHRNRSVDVPCYIDEKIVKKFSKLPDSSIRKYFNYALKNMLAGSLQICIPFMIHPSGFKLSYPFGSTYGFNDLQTRCNNFIT